MKLLIIGYGKMGQLIEKKALEQGHEVIGRISSSNIHELDNRWKNKVDCAIEFTNPSVVTSNLLKCLDLNIPIVTGTTGWEKESEKIFTAFKNENGSLFYASNYSIGANILFKLNDYLAQMMARQDTYELSITEIHHLQKKDAPSGTAITLANGIIKNTSKTEWTNNASTNPELVSIISKREDQVPGTHIIQYNSIVDELIIKHKAHNRDGFAIGALTAASFLQNKTGIYTMNDLV